MTAWQVAVRADASRTLGSGHVMRCLTLAQALRAAGAQVQFICRSLPGHLGSHIAAQGFAVQLLPEDTRWTAGSDAAHTLAAIGPTPVDWLVVDHYALDALWQHTLRPACRQLLAIDDLADRPHAADLLLDQNLGRAPTAYAGLLPPGATCLIGPQHALLRPAFAAARAASLARRGAAGTGGRLRHLLVSMGGADPQGATARLLQALAGAPLPADLQLTVVLGAIAHTQADTRAAVQAALAALPWPGRLLVDTPHMAALLAEADLVLGAAGSSAWERCCLGVPTLQLVLAPNQQAAADALAAVGAAATLPMQGDWPTELQCWLGAAAAQAPRLQAMSAAAAAVTDGLGTGRVLAAMATVAAKATAGAVHAAARPPLTAPRSEHA